MKRRLAASLLLLLLASAARAAQSDTVRWRRVTPDGEEFTALMPAAPYRVRRELTLADGTKLTPPVFELGSGGVLYSVVSFEKTATAARTPDALAELFRQAVASADAKEKSPLVFEQDLTPGGLAVKQYALRALGKQGTARVYEAPAHFYVVLTLGAKAGELRADNFFNSFSLDRAAAASDAVPWKRVGGAAPEPPKSLWPWAGSQKVFTMADFPTQQSGGEAGAASSPKPVLAIGRVVSKPPPAYPRIAASARASGEVIVLFVADEEGYVIDAVATSGHPLLQPAAVEAARQARFTPTTLDGKPLKVGGQLTYNFVLR